MSGRFLKVTVGDEFEHRNLSRWLEQSGVEFKSFMLKQDRPVKVVIRGLPSNTEPEDIKTEIEAEGFKVAKISQMKNYRTKAPMPLFYLQIENGVDAPKIFDFTELFGKKSISVGVVKGGSTLRRCATFRHAAPKPKNQNNNSKKSTPQAPRPDISKARKVSPNLDYSKVVQNLIPREHVSPPTPAPSKDAIVNAGLLKDLLVIIEDTPCIDKKETWPEPGIDPQIANYRLFKDDRIEFPHTVTRGGTAIYCKNEIVHNRVPLPAMQGIDAPLLCKLKSKIPLPSILSRRTLELKSSRYGISLCNLVRNLRGAKLVAPQTATHLQPRQRFGSIIDLAVFKHIPYNHSIRVLSDLSSDHYPVILEINLNTSIIKNPEQLSTNWFNFKFALNKKPLPTTDLTSNENLELAISELNQKLSEDFVEASKPKFKNAPKILSPEIKYKIHQRNRLRKFWQRTRCPSIYSEFRTLSREIAKDIQSHSRTQLEKHIEALSPEDNTLWRKSSLLRKPFRSIPPLQGALGSTAITPIEKAEVIADSLQEQFEPNHVVGREEFDQRIHAEVENFLATPHVQKIEPTTPTEVLTYVQRIKPKKSPGLDQISNRVGTRHPFRWGKETHSPNSICCKQQQGRCKNYSCNLRDRRPPITPPLFQINKTKNNETQKFQLSKCKYKIALASAHPTQEKFIDENVHIKVQKKFKQTLLPFNRHFTDS
ncbi:RNA-directed DNA polymerase from mobile element jockey [Trichonephila clavipes]|nr:RNA-directed DNA polymerase from mobile element jockey [Trichonephila clavipes]